MRIAILGDLHGNLPAVEAVDRDLDARGVDAVYCLGDMVGKGPSSPETLDWALKRCQVLIQGNWDEGICCSGFTHADWFRAQLGEARVQALVRLPREHRFLLSGRRVRLLHGRNLLPGLVYSDSPLGERQAMFDTPDNYQPQVVGFADIHQPFYQQIFEKGSLFNTGSVGNALATQPYATYIILEGEMGEALAPLSHTIVQLPYDYEAALRLVRQTKDLPYAQAFANEIVTGRYSR